MLFNEPRRRFVSQTWLFKPTLSVSQQVAEDTYYIKFVCDGVQYNKIKFESVVLTAMMKYSQLVDDNTYRDTIVYNQKKWADQKYRTITLLEEPSADLLTFLQKNAVLQ